MRDLVYESGTEFIPCVRALFAQEHRQAEGAAFPWRREDELAILPRQRGLALEVGDAVVDAHRAALSAGMRGRATPIIQSRVTISPSLHSNPPSVPARPSGSTL